MFVSQCGLDYTPVTPAVKRRILKILPYLPYLPIQLSSGMNDLNHLRIRQKYSKI
jgi:hypothetical protein